MYSQINWSNRKYSLSSEKIQGLPDGRSPPFLVTGDRNDGSMHRFVSGTNVTLWFFEKDVACRLLDAVGYKEVNCYERMMFPERDRGRMGLGAEGSKQLSQDNGYKERHDAHFGIMVPYFYLSKAVRFTESLEGRF